MPLKGFTRNIIPLNILTQEQVEAIHMGTLDVLEVTGIRFESEKALKIFEKNDCIVDFEDGRVRFPSSLVEEILRQCPSSFTMRSRNPRHNVRIGGNTLYFSDMPGKGILDLHTFEVRKATREESHKALTILDALENFHILCSYTPYFEIEGVIPAMSIPECVAAKMRYSTKVQWTGYQNDCELFNIEMAKATNQDIMGLGLPSAPLTYYSDACESIIRFAEAGFPINFASGCMIGGTSPATIAGTLVSFDAEVIGGIVLAQLVKPGAKVVVEDTILPMDMRTGAPVFGSITACLHIAAFGQVWRKYGIPTFADSGWTCSKKIDFQNGYERSITTLVIALSGCNVANLFGGVYGELAFHPLQAVLDDDVAGMVGRFIEGVTVNKETLAVDLIEEIGPIPGHFLTSEHTRKYFDKEGFFPKAADTLPYEEWREGGRKDALMLAEERMNEILKTHTCEPLPDEQDREIEKILNRAREYYRNR
ncbi:MAG: trimethylamine methyltransferase family protein [Thermodesulfovibrionales bacterium]